MSSKNDFWDSKPVRIDLVDKKRSILISLVPSDTGRILDVACGNGLTLSKLYAKEKYGIDINKKNIKASRKIGIKSEKKDVEEGLPYKNNYFDVVISEGLLQHLYSPENLIKEVKRVLKPGGFFIGHIPNNYHIWHRMAFLFNKPGKSFLFRNKAAHITSSFFSVRSLRLMLSRHFEIEVCKGIIGKFSMVYPSLFSWDIIWKAKKL